MGDEIILANAENMEIKTIRSHRRKRTISARLEENTIIVQAPANLAEERLEKIVSDFKIKFEKKKIKDDLDRKEPVKNIAERLNAKYFGGRLKINSVEYVTDQSSKFGCCACHSGNIRVSHKVGQMPKWVRDYVLIHEMAHLVEPNHSKAFWNILSRYRLSERARGYLMAQSMV